MLMLQFTCNFTVVTETSVMVEQSISMSVSSVRLSAFQRKDVVLKVPVDFIANLEHEIRDL